VKRDFLSGLQTGPKQVVNAWKQISRRVSPFFSSPIQKENRMTTQTLQFGGKEFILETGKLAKQAGGSVIVRSGETVLLATACMSKKPKEGIDFFPLTVEVQEKYYAAGKIPGGFFKREARSQSATLLARLTDRPLRPLFPEGFRNEVQVIITVLAYDGVNMPEWMSIVGASAALSISEIPFQGPVGAVIVGMVDGNYILNPSPAELELSTLQLSIAGTRDAIMMVESGSKEISEEQMLGALEFGHNEIKKLVDAQDKLVKSAGKTKAVVAIEEIPADILKEADALTSAKFNAALSVSGKHAQEDALDAAKDLALAHFKQKLGEEKFAEQEKLIKRAIEDIKYREVRKQMLDEKKRADGRKLDQIRPIASEVGVLPRTHGTGLFTRGETQALVVVTLGSKDGQQMIDGMDELWFKNFYLHYNFPPYSVGEVGRMGAPGRRELGHGALAERALEAVIPTEEEFPYTIRIVSEILESNGSSSMASVCGGSLALMDAGVPIKAPVAGIAMGLVKEGDKYVVLSDIQGLEDHLGDMDFKVAGSEKGITALQMDIKIQGITKEIMKQALDQAKAGRMHILKEMGKAITAHRSDLSAHAPRIAKITIPQEKIGLIIGPGGANIKKIAANYNVTVDIDDDGSVAIAAVSKDGLEGAKAHILGMVREAKEGEVYDGKVVRIVDFGAFIEVLPGKDGLLHISKISNKRIDRVEDVLSLGQSIKVKVAEVDKMGRINLVTVDKL